MLEEAKTVKFSIDDGVATVRLDREHGNAINDDLLHDLVDAYGQVTADTGIGGVLLTAAGKLFSPGLDLRELTEFDRAEMHRFMSRLTACLLVMFTCPKPVVAAVGGHALAGGCVLALTADRRMLREGMMIGLNEVKVGVPLPFGVGLILREAARTPRTEEIALLGKNYSGDDAVAVGLAHEIVPDEGFEDRCIEHLRELMNRDPRAYGTTKRYLRSQTVERIRANDSLLLPEFLDCWFSESTRARIESIVEGLGSSAR